MTGLENGLGVKGRIDQRVHDVEQLRERVDDWDELSEKERSLVVRPPETIDTDKLDTDELKYAEIYVQPTKEETTYNITVDSFHQYFVDNLDPGNTGPEANISATHLALGTDGASGTTASDSDLNTRVYSTAVTDHADNGKELLCSTFLDSNEGNGNTFDELGLFTGDPANLANADVFMLNHSTFAGVSKDSSSTVTFDVTLTFSDV